MPSPATIPDVTAFLAAYSAATRGERGSLLNLRRGSGYDIPGGSAALLWASQAQRDRDGFRQVYAETATGARLGDLVERRYGVERERASYGTGELLLMRASGGTDGTMWAGTRVVVLGGERPVPYAVSADVPVAASDAVVRAPIQATKLGPGVAVAVGAALLRLDDSVFDAAFAPIGLTCTDGTAEEPDAAYLARARQERRARRVGHVDAIVRACNAEGAANVVVLGPDAFGLDPDFGVTHVYVGDAGYSTPAGLLDACARAVESVRVAGCDMQVLPMAVVPLVLTATLTLWSSPGAFDQIAIKRDALNALLAEFERRGDFWLFRLDALAGAIVQTSTAIRSATLGTTPTEPASGFVATLPRYTLVGTDVTIVLEGP